MTEWRPIETAPKDGTIIDLWCVDDSDPATIKQTRRPTCQWGEIQDWKGNVVEGWRGRGTKYSTWTPTHWMPLPEPPRPGYLRTDMTPGTISAVR